ncbi:CrpP-related protein [Paucibacter sp. R3-3]|uniref:CrpP-related protein n=1 Tax=Roseateles agri TaxID=3098619 RepID=A0ABU5DLZ5_9BURK|nr:CrpP-related protein [Paucibacter sp. R3-3]MDY0747317.1 CrpP-related protein [Paucibacter sp. R3-3]
MVKRSSNGTRPPKPRPADQMGVSTAERDELRRQGAKAAARGEHSISNPMGEHSNMPGSTGESVDTWQLRKRAWQRGHDAQSRAIDAGRADPGAQAGAADAANGRRPIVGPDDLAAIAEDIRRARATLSALLRSDEGIRSLARHTLGSDLERLTRKIEAAVAVQCTLGGHLISPGISIGTAIFPDDGDQAEALVRIADAAMYRAKRIRRLDSLPS